MGNDIRYSTPKCQRGRKSAQCSYRRGTRRSVLAAYHWQLCRLRTSRMPPVEGPHPGSNESRPRSSEERGDVDLRWIDHDSLAPLPRRSSLVTISVSPSRTHSSMRVSSGRSRFLPYTFSSKIILERAAVSLASCSSSDCATVETRA